MSLRFYSLILKRRLLEMTWFFLSFFLFSGTSIHHQEEEKYISSSVESFLKWRHHLNCMVHKILVYFPFIVLVWRIMIMGVCDRVHVAVIYCDYMWRKKEKERQRYNKNGIRKGAEEQSVLRTVSFKFPLWQFAVTLLSNTQTRHKTHFM